MDNDTQTAFGGVLAALHPLVDARLRVSEARDIAIVAIMARKHQTANCLRAIDRACGVACEPGKAAQRDPHVLVGTGPGAWLLLGEAPAQDWLTEVSKAVGSTGSVFDQSSGYAVLRIEGADAAQLLQKGMFIDLHDATFPVGSAASSLIAHVAVTVWRSGDAKFQLAVPRSYAASIWHWLTSAAAAEGLMLARPTS